MAISNHPLIAERYLFPRRAPLPNPWVVPVDGAELHCLKRSAGPDAPWLVHFHGNGEVVRDWSGDFVDTLVQRGVSVVLAEYREYGGSTGQARLGELCPDALAIVDALDVPADRVLVYGRSIGSIPALHVAAQRPVRGLVIESGIADVHERIAMRVWPSELGIEPDQLQAELRAEFDHQAKMHATTCPVLVMHTHGDHMVHPSHAERLANWAGERAALRMFDEGDHNSIYAYNSDEMLALVSSFALHGRVPPMGG